MDWFSFLWQGMVGRYRGWSSMGTFEGTHVEAEIALGEAGV